MNATHPLRLSCPKCSATVRAPASLAGKRVKCPKCGGAIKVPGAVQVAGDDEDWLSLDDPLPRSSATAGPKANATAGPKVGSAAESPAEPAAKSAAGAAEWWDDLPSLSADSGSDDPFVDDRLASGPAAPGPAASGDPRSPGDPHSPGPGGNAGGVRDEAPVVTEYRAKCPVCGSVLFVRPQQAGRSIRCSDCHSQFVVPPPPPLPVAKPKVDLDRVATFGLSEPAGDRDSHTAPGAKSAAEYLREAEDAEVEEDLSGKYDAPDIGGWLRGIFGIFTDPSVTAYWLMLSILGALPGIVAVAIGHPLFMVFALALTVIYTSLVVACGFAILETVAGGGRRVDEWPVFNPAEWLAQAFTAMAAIVLSALPGLLLGYPIFGPTMASVALVMFTTFLLFPYVLLSMLDNGTVFMPVSSEVTKSVTRCMEPWGALYFSSMLLFFFQFIATAVLLLMPPIAAIAFDSLLWVGFIFVYFAMIGRLAFAIGQPIHGEVDEA